MAWVQLPRTSRVREADWNEFKNVWADTLVTLLGSLGVQGQPSLTIKSYYEGKFLMFYKASVKVPAAAQV